jgi:glycosyltransferase involved in cell wall biosynthesis
MSEPLISVIIPSFEHAHSLPFCLASILGQTYKNVEIIVVDDGSTDGTSDVLKGYDGKITVVSQSNQGSNPARNRGLKEAKGEYVIFADADVVMKPEMLLKLKTALDNNPAVSYAYSGFTFGWKTFKGTEFSQKKLKQLNFIHTTALVRKSDFPGFDESIRRLQDWDVWLTMLEQKKIGVLVPEVLFNVRIDGASRIGSSWLPKIVYRFPWKILPWKPMRIEKYEAARKIILDKHSL